MTQEGAEQGHLVIQGSCLLGSFCDIGGSGILLERAVESSSSGGKDVEMGKVAGKQISYSWMQIGIKLE